MEIRRIDEGYGASGQIQPSDVPVIQAMGYRTILCLRPDDEDEGDQPLFESIAAAAEQNRVRAVHLPIASGGPDSGEQARFDALIGTLEGPVLAYCRGGGRAARLRGAPG